MAKKNKQVKKVDTVPEEMAPVMEEAIAPQPAVVSAIIPQFKPSEKVDFDAWFVMRGSKIPKNHHKEVVRADFKGRGLSQCESLEAFDAALRKYGINLV